MDLKDKFGELDSALRLGSLPFYRYWPDAVKTFCSKDDQKKFDNKLFRYKY